MISEYAWIGHQVAHRVIMENHLGRKLLRYEIVHHINGDKKDNRLENLQLILLKDHSILHSKPAEMTTIICDVCGKEYQIRTKFYEWRKTKQSFFACSKRCVGLHCKDTLPHPNSIKNNPEIILKIKNDKALGLSIRALATRYKLNRRTITSYLN